ncbi:MAG TPA: SIMPL domain-containing protein [Tessaracoccus flavescens]|uniref:SIMPL domain-containing protein n=1 Tax=Tessaracoccus flavescens TaxID=399497 RepID=A0A921JRG6_9ACTN|nr:SIMPL domain-containing protein [Tessaracoccus flavescens]
MQITVQGHASAAYRPERATVHLTIGFEGAEKERVLAQATELGNALAHDVEAIKAQADSPVTWSAMLPISTRSWRPYSNEGKVLPIRHAASAQVKIKFRDFKALSRFIDQWGGRDGVTVGWVEWALTEERRVREENSVLTRAVEAAYDRAQTMARAANAGDVRFLEVADPGLMPGARAETQMAYSMKARGAADTGGEGINLAPEDVELEATVHARFTTD